MDSYSPGPQRYPAKCSDCEAHFTVTFYPGDITEEVFVRDHPQNGCYVTGLRAIRTERNTS